MSAVIRLPEVALVAIPPVAAMFVGPENAIALTGHNWRWCRDTARRFGVPILRPAGSAKSAIPAGLFAEVLARHGAPRRTEAIAPEPGSADELELMRRQVRDARRSS